MAGIVELYRKHQDLLSVYFKSEEEAAECERRAEMGDDRAMRVLSLAYNRHASTPYRFITFHDHENGDRDQTYEEGTTTFAQALALGRPPIQTGKRFYQLDGNLRDYYHLQSQNHYNFLSLDFAKSVMFGCRSLSTPNCELGWPQEEYYHSLLPAGFDSKSPNTLRQELSIFRRHDGSEPSTENSAFFLIHRSPSANIHSVHWGEKNAGIIYSVQSNVDVSNWPQDLKNIHALTQCANSGSVDAARKLASIYKQQTFYEVVVKSRWFNPSDYRANPLHDSTKAKYWERVAEHLEGKSATPIEREKFLQEFLYSQDKTPEGLYNIGYALCHNPHIGDFNRGIDYLKHAANLGNANAARELGEQYHTSAEQNHNSPEQLRMAYFWYQVAASTPMKVTDADGKVVDYDGHPNAKARVAYLAKAHPELAQSQPNEAELRNPSAAHIRQYPASMWAAEVPITDLTDIIRNPSRGGMVGRMEEAVRAINGQVREFEVLTSAIQAQIDELIARQAVLDGRVDGLKGEEITALRHNDGLSAEQRKSERAIRISKDRWIKETAANLGATALVGLMTGGTSFVAETFRLIGHGNPASPGMYGANLMRANKIRATGYYAVMENEVAHHQALIEELEARKIDTAKFPDQIRALAETVQQVADSQPMKRLMQDETRARAIVEGYLRQRILKSGLENCRLLEEYASANGIASVDALLGAFEGREDGRLHQALNNLCYGHANSNDMQVLLEDVNGMKGDALAPHEKALKRFVERSVKGNLEYYMTRASQIDVIADLKLVDFDTMSVDHSKAVGDLVRASSEPSGDEMGRRQVDAQTRLALTAMFSNQFGVSHIGQYDVTRMFRYYLHRHGKDELIAAELHDGQVSDRLAAKQVNIKPARAMKGFVERAKASANRQREDQPNVGDLFLRTCGYEYYLPQAVVTSGRDNRFRENPEAPVCYPMINRVIQDFIERMSLTDIATYRQQVGTTESEASKLDGVIAQTFIDFFQQVGREHAAKFSNEREWLRDAHASDSYGPRFDAYEDKITDDVLGQFDVFLEVYARNLARELQGTPEAEANVLRQQIASLDANARNYLAPNIPETGSHEARLAARERDHRGENMTEGWRFAG